MELYWYMATCDRVIDGDTIKITIDFGMETYRKERIRLYGINTPEIFGVKKESEEYALGIKAKNRLEELLLDKTFYVNTIKDRKGKYGRYLANIYVDLNDEKVCINELLISEGLADKY